MKKLQLLLAATMCGLVIQARALDTAVQGYGTVVRVAGEASYTLGDNQWHPLQAGKYLPVGSTIRTGQNGTVDVVLGKNIQLPQAAWQPQRISFAADAPVRGMVNYKPSAEQNVIRVTPNTTIGIEKLTVTDTGADTVSDTELNLKQGKIYASVKKLTGASQYLIKLPNGIAGVRGTLFSISADGSCQCYDSKAGGVLLSMIGDNGNANTGNILPGQGCGPGGTGIFTLPQDLMKTLGDIFAMLCTTYLEVVNYSFDHTHCYVSPTQGQGGNSQGQNNNNQGGGGDGGNNQG